MNEALQAAYEYFTEQGYNGSVEEFVSLLNTNSEALDATYTIFTEQGYAGSADDFSGYLGLKKKDETEIDMVSELETGISQPTELSRNQRLNIATQPEKDTWVERTFGKTELTDFFGDMYRAWKTGGGQAASVDDALSVFAQGTNVSDKALQKYIEAVENMESFAPSEEMQDFSRIYEREGKGVKGFIKGLLKNPTAGIQVAVSSLRAMLNLPSLAAGAAGAGAGSLAGPIGTAMGGIAGMTGALETGLSYTEFLKEELGNRPFTDENIRSVLEDEEALGKITRRTLARGATISAVNALTGGLAAGVAAKVTTTLGSRLAGAGAGLLTQAVGGGTGEALGRAAAGQEMDVAEIGFEAIGEIAGPTVIGTVIGATRAPVYKVNTEKVTEETIEDIINKSDNYLDLQNTNIEIIDNPVLEQALETKKKQLLDELTMENSLTPEQLEAATPQDIQDLVSLQNLYNKYKDKETAAGIKNAARFKIDLDNKIDAIQKRSTETLDAKKSTPDGETVGKGDTQQQPITGKIAPKETKTTKPGEEVTTETETEESQVVPQHAGMFIPIVTRSSKYADDAEHLLGDDAEMEDRRIQAEAEKWKKEGRDPHSLIQKIHRRLEFNLAQNEWFVDWVEGFIKGDITTTWAEFRKGPPKDQEVTTEVAQETPTQTTIEEGEQIEEDGTVYTKTAQVKEKDGIATTSFLFKRNPTHVSVKALEKRGFQIDPKEWGVLTAKLAKDVTATFEVREISERETGAIAIGRIIYTAADFTQTVQDGVSMKLVRLEEEIPGGAGDIPDKKAPTQTTTEVETVEETYTLPEDPKEAKKDFEIIDNRKGFAEEVNDNGDNKWIVVNIKTGSTVTAPTKSVAQNLQSNPVWDYGEGKPVLQEFRTKVEEKVVEEVAPPTHKIGDFDVVIDNNKIVSITKDGKETDSASRNKVVKELLDQGVITLDETVTNFEGTYTPSQLTSKIIKSSTNPKEVASALQQERENRKGADVNELKSLYDPNRYLDVKLSEEDFSEFYDKADLTPTIRRYWIDKNAHGLDGTAEDIVRDISNLSTTIEGEQVSIETGEWIAGLKDFIVENPTRNPEWLKGGKPLVEVDLELKFTELTGLKHTPFNVQAVIDAPTQQELQERADIQEGKRVDEEQRQGEIKGVVEKKAPEKKEVETEEKAKKDQAKKIKEAERRGEKKIIQRVKENRNRKNALSNIKRGKLGTEGVTVVLRNIFLVNPKDIRRLIKAGVLPANTMEKYNALAEEVGQRKAVLEDMTEVRELKKKADALYNSIINDINKEVEGVGEAEVKEVDVKGLVRKVLSMPMKINQLLEKASRDLAGKIKRLTPADLNLLIEETEDGEVDTRNLEKLKLVKENINAGLVPAAANDLVNIIEVKKSNKLSVPVVKKIKIKGLQSGLRKATFEIGKALNLIKSGNFFEAVMKSNPKTVFDDLLGNSNDTTIFTQLIRDVAAAFSTYDVDRGKVLKEIIEKIEKLIAFDGRKNIARPQNDIVEDKIKIMTYLLQLEHESNPLTSDSTKSLTPSAIAIIHATIKFHIANGTPEVDVTVKLLKKIEKEFSVDGEIDINKLYNSFSSNSKKAITLYREGFDGLADKTNFVSAILRREKVDLFNNYVMHPVLYGTPADSETAHDLRKNSFTQNPKPSTKGGPLYERTLGAKALNFDPSYALMRATDDILLDFNMTNAIRQFRMKINALKETEGLTTLQRQAVVALENSMERALSSTFDSINSDPSATDTLINFVRKVGYEAALVSAPRAAAEFASNFLFGISSNPDALMDGIKNYRNVAMNTETMLNFLNNVNSTESTKLANVDELTGKFADDQGMKKYTRGAGKAAGPLKNVILQILNYGPKQLRNFTADLSNRILSYPDQMIGRPLYLGEFVRVFEEKTGIKLTEKEIQKIADGESKYLSLDYAEAINKAAIAADKQAIMSTTSRNPILAIEKFKSDPKANMFKQIYIQANAFMSNFFAFEYTTARSAVNALLNQGEISPKQARGLLVGVTMRMTFYTLIYQVLSDFIDQAFREKDEDDLDEAQEILDLTGRSLTGSILTLLTRQTMGNVPFAAISYGLELFNEANLGALRSDEEYDKYKHGIVYSMLGKSDLETNNLITNAAKVLAGPYSIIWRKSESAYAFYKRTKSRKTQSARDAAQEELNKILLRDIAGNAGLLPFYKDISRIAGAKRRAEYKQKEGAMSKSELKKLNPRLYKKLYGPGSVDARLRALKRKLKSN